MSELYAFDLDGTMIPGALAEMAFVELTDRGLLNLSGETIDEVMRLSPTNYNEYVRQSVRKLNDGVRGAQLKTLTPIARLIAEREIENVFEEIKDELTAARKIGAKIVIISASPQLFVESFANILDSDYAYGAQWHMRDGIVRDDIDQHNVRFDKGLVLSTIANNLRSTPFAAFGDTRNDIPMLELSRRAVAVNPKPDLREKALATGWEIIDCAPRTSQ